MRIYRELRWGMLDLLLTDLRSYRSAPPVPAGLVEALGLAAMPVELVDICDAGLTTQVVTPPLIYRLAMAVPPTWHKTASPAAYLARSKHSGFATSWQPPTHTGKSGAIVCPPYPCGWT